MSSSILLEQPEQWDEDPFTKQFRQCTTYHVMMLNSDTPEEEQYYLNKWKDAETRMQQLAEQILDD